MAAELEINAQTGIANVFSVRQSMWHRDGHVLTEAPDKSTARRLAGHDFEVEVRPTFREIISGTDKDGLPIRDYVESTNAKVTVRTDTGAELGAVGNWYTPLQNDEAFSVLDPLLDAGVAALETGGTLRGGADVWLQVRFDLAKFGPHARTVFGDEVVPFGLIANNHSGRRGCLMSLTPIRVVCANTLGAAEGSSGARMDNDDDAATTGRAIVIRHTQSVASRAVEAAEQLFTSIVQRYELVATQYAALKATRLAEAEFRTMVLDLIAPDPRAHRAWNPEARMAESVVERAVKRRAEVTRLWTEGTGHTGDHSAWEAYNAVAESLDHDEHGLWPLRTGVYRTQSLLQGEYGKMKQRTLNTLVAFAAK